MGLADKLKRIIDDRGLADKCVYKWLTIRLQREASFGETFLPITVWYLESNAIQRGSTLSGALSWLRNEGFACSIEDRADNVNMVKISWKK